MRVTLTRVCSLLLLLAWVRPSFGMAAVHEPDGVVGPYMDFWASPCTVGDIAILRRLAKLDDQQAGAAIEVLETAETEIAAARRRAFLRYEKLVEESPKVNEDAAARAPLKPTYEKYLREREDAERRFLDDLRVILNSGQTSAWEQFVRIRRIRAIKRDEHAPWPALEEVVEHAELKGEQRVLADLGVSSQRENMDAVVDELLRSQGALTRMHEGSWIFDGSKSEEESLNRKIRDGSRHMRESVDRGIRAIAANLAPEAAERVLAQYQVERIVQISNQRRPRSDNMVRDVLAVSTLTEEQNARVERHVRRAEAELARLYKDFVDVRSAHRLGDETIADKAEALQKEVWKAAIPVWQMLRKDVKAVLTEEQRRAFDAGDEPPLRPPSPRKREIPRIEDIDRLAEIQAQEEGRR
ncbi:MAG: hypothetical protein IT435_08195 [Phycisphaerales bacterium]|nr:hypothetical protein [Phycisphaerales bacterium]